MRTLTDFINDLPQEACVVIGRVGDGQKLTTFFRACTLEVKDTYKPSEKDTVPTKLFLDIDEAIEKCMDFAQDEGWGIEYSTLRIIVQTVTKQPCGTKVLRKEITDTFEHNDSMTAIQALTNANIRMSEEIRRVLKEVNENNKEHLHTIATLTNAFVQTKSDMVDMEREVMIKDLALSMPDTDDDTKSEGLQLLNKVVNGYFQHQEMNIDEKIKDTIKNNKEKVREFMQDPEVVNSIKDVIFGDVQNEE